MDSPTQSADKPTCHERRHMDAHVFATYDALRACTSKTPHEFYGSPYALANLTNRSVETERTNLETLLNDGWIVDLNSADKQRRNKRGRFDRNRFRVVQSHEEFIDMHAGSCPPLKYVLENDEWKLATPGKLKKGLVRANRKKALEKFATEIEQAIQARSIGTVVTGPAFPELVALGAGRFEEFTGTSPLVPVEPAATSALPAPTQARCERADTSPLVTDRHKPVAVTDTSPLVREPEVLPESKNSIKNLQPSIQPKVAPENDRPDGRMEEGVCFSSEPSQPTTELEEYTGPLPTDEELEKSYQRYSWTQMQAQLPEEMRGAVPSKAQQEEISKHLTGPRALDAEYYIAAMNDWIEERELPVSERKFNKWGAWLAECAPYLESQRELQSTDRRRKRLLEIEKDIKLLYPNVRWVFCESKNAIPISSWVVIRQCSGQAHHMLRADIHPTEEVARKRALTLCNAPKESCVIDSHIVRRLVDIENDAYLKQHPEEAL